MQVRLINKAAFAYYLKCIIFHFLLGLQAKTLYFCIKRQYNALWTFM